MANKSIRENSFDGSPAGGMGTVNYQTPLNTHTSPSATQDPNKFNSADRNKAIGTNSNTRKDGVDPVDIDKMVDQIYSKKKVPSADEVKCGLDFELSNMIKPDKAMAKELVLKNLQKDPEYYGKLHHLNIDDDEMEVTPLNETLKNVNVEETKKIFGDLLKQKNNKYVVNSHIVDAMRMTAEDKKKRRAWQVGDPTF